MLKNILIMAILGLSVALSGCEIAGSQPSSQKSDVTKVNDNQSNQQASEPSPTSTNTSSSQTSVTPTDSGKTTKTTPATQVKNTSTKSKVNMSMVTAVRLADFSSGWVGGNGWMAKTTTGGKSWTVVYQGSGTVQQIFALNHSDVWAAVNQGGNNVRLLKSADGGQHWAVIGIIPCNAYLHFTSKNTALCGNYFSQNGGETWRALSIPKNVVGEAYFHDVKNGWSVTQSKNTFYVNRTRDGGKSWSGVMSKSLFSPINGALIRSTGKDDAWVELIGGTGMTQTSYTVLHTIDDGSSWKTVIANSTAGGGPAPGFSQNYNKGPNNKGSKPGPLYVVNPQVAFMGGTCPACDNPNSIGWTKDAGKTWVNSTVALTGYGDSYLAISDENHGWWITTENEKPSRMYTTSDGGVHWNLVHIFQ
ncbi:MAG: hypothetical protein Q8934_07465 [Bacillota bacterium]|nr:hypothetical protein [Bacillota bacterium]